MIFRLLFFISEPVIIIILNNFILLILHLLLHDILGYLLALVYSIKFPFMSFSFLKLHKIIHAAFVSHIKARIMGRLHF